MNRKQKIIVSVVGIFIVLLILVGLTYAYFLTRIKGNTNEKSVTVTTAELSLEYGDGNGIVESSEKLHPGSVVKFKTTDNDIVDTKTFSVTNNGDDTVNYIVVVENTSVVYTTTTDEVTEGDVTTFIRPEDFIYTLTCTQSDENECNGVVDGIYPMNDSAILVTNEIGAGITQNYTLSMVYKEAGVDQSADMNKTFTSKINIKDPNRYNPFLSNTRTLAYNIINNASNKINGTEFVTTPKTQPSKDISYSSNYSTTEVDAYADKNYDVTVAQQGYNWTYATSYKIDSSTGKFTLEDPKLCVYNESNCISSLINSGTDVYLVGNSASNNSNSAATMKTTKNLANIYKVVEAPIDSANTVTIKTKAIYPVAESSEKEILSSPDEYGTSYYYRGDVRDNYVNFGGYCWRIVRIEGDGSIKLILEDKNTTCNSENFTGEWNLGSNKNYGYTEETVESTTYRYADYENSANRENSQKYVMNEWYTTNLTSLYSKLKSETVCIGATDNKYTEDGTVATDLTQNYYYDNYKRLVVDNAPSFNCTGTKGSESKIFPITADEVVFAGGKRSTANYSYYLLNNYQRLNTKYFWTSSPAYFYASNTRDYAFSVYYTGYLMSNNVYYSNASHSVRPAVSLASGAEITSGDGTKTNPYIIQ